MWFEDPVTLYVLELCKWQSWIYTVLQCSMRPWVYTNNFICVFTIWGYRSTWYKHVIIYRSNHLATRAMWNGSRAEQDDLGFAEWVHRLGVKACLCILFYRFFAELNTVLFRTMMDVSSCDDHVMTTEMMVRLGLDPVYDKGFISDLAVLYGFDVVVQRNVGMCSCFTDCYCLD